ncbi:MAG: YeaH/YhbH family protein [Pseudomonadota bacterium]
MQIVDRRLNPQSKSLGNRQRFMRRAKAEIREAVKEALQKRKIADLHGGEQITIRSKSLREPSFGLSRDTGERDYVLPGNRDFQVGDEIPKPDKGGGKGGRKGSPDGEGQDDFTFTLTKDEFLDMFFEDLFLPNLVKTKLKNLKSPTPQRAGFQTDGSPSRLNHVRTMRRSLARRQALGRPSEAKIKLAEEALAAAEAKDPRDNAEVEALRSRLEHLKRLRKSIAFIDPLDLQFNRFERVPKPTTQAVMFCLMDASASMTQTLKDLAKRFFMLLHVFLSKHYREVDIVFIRHTSRAAEVDEQTFFYGDETGGTIVSTAFDEMMRVVAERYPPADWNIYAAQASDGDNFYEDTNRCLDLLENHVLPVCQYFAYIQVHDEDYMVMADDSPLWSGYGNLVDVHPNFAMRQVSSPIDIYPVFHDLFSKSGTEAAS